MPVPITALYLAIFALFAGALAFLPGKIRGSSGISVGGGGRADPLVAMRRHGNFVEYVPCFVIMFAALELNGATAAWLHGLGIAMIASRIFHAVGLEEAIESVPRGIGAGGTLLVILIAAGKLFAQFLGA